MFRKILISFVILFLAFVSSSLATEPFWGTVKKIIDGDSLVIASGKTRIETRLYGVDCPEYNQPFSKEAKALVRAKFYRKKVLVRPQYYDSYKRLVAIVDYGDQTLNAELVRAGLAWVYPNYCRKKICKSWKKMEKSAKKKQKGLWSSNESIPPWKWKRMRHGS
jgi:micrococcal nuclease